MMNTSRIERKEYEIECLSPVHIGNGTVLKAFEYLYDRKEQKVYFIDEGKWIRLLARRQLMDDFAAYIQEVSVAMGRRGPFKGDNVWEWLIKRGVPATEIRKIAIMTADVTTNNKLLDRGSLNDIARNVATADGMLYIPGSSIKGALRTGIIYGMIKKGTANYRRYWGDFAECVAHSRHAREVQKTAENIIKKIEKDVLQKLVIPSKERLSGAVLDSMRGLSVSDAQCVEQIHRSVILQKVDGTAKENNRNGQEVSLPVFRECIYPGTRLRCVISIDKPTLDSVGISSIDDILQMTKEFIQEGIHMQKNVFGRYYEMELAMAEDADIILGGGTGFLTKSILYALAPSRREGVRIAAKYLDLAFRRSGRGRDESAHKHVMYDRDISPRTIKLTRVGMEKSIMGLCYIHEV